MEFGMVYTRNAWPTISSSYSSSSSSSKGGVSGRVMDPWYPDSCRHSDSDLAERTEDEDDDEYEDEKAIIDSGG
ncbi:MAG: hypothetical protein JO275_03385 [Verrucomicrobia bacterium]|nr:hypothetical protein [Verrucomicrobiota bacterium]